MSVARLFLVANSVLWVSSATGQNTADNAWSKTFAPPEKLATARVHLEPLAPKHAQLDHEAVMSSRQHLRKTLRWGDWPADVMTLADNRRDLKRHWREFEKREAYAYTVLSPDKKRCLGCIYIKPVRNDPRAAGMAYWVAEGELADDLDKHLVESVLEWIQRDWPIDTLVMPLHTENTRGVAIAEELDLRQAGPVSRDMIRFVWQRATK